jgi:sulfur-oxidizing protein SoxB
MGSRIGDLHLKGKPIDANKTCRVAGWAPVSEDAAKAGNKPIWDIVETWLRERPDHRLGARTVNTPRPVGVDANPGAV